MSGEGMISEVAAVKEAGVSARTLQRFSEAGYLTVQVKGDGDRLYSRSQLLEIFGYFQEGTTAPSTPTETDSEAECDEATSCDTSVSPY